MQQARKVVTVEVLEDVLVAPACSLAQTVYAGRYLLEVSANCDPALVTPEDIWMECNIRVLERLGTGHRSRYDG